MIPPVMPCGIAGVIIPYGQLRRTPSPLQAIFHNHYIALKLSKQVLMFYLCFRVNRGIMISLSQCLYVIPNRSTPAYSETVGKLIVFDHEVSLPLTELGFGIVGAGAISPLHISAIKKCEGAHLVAISDVVEARARAVGEEHGIAWYTDYHKMFEDPNVHIICVCTPSGLRGQICIDAAHAGKHIVAEKPLEVTLEKIDAIIDACDGAKVKLAVIFQVRFLPGLLALKKAVDEGRLGKLIMGDAYIKWFRSQDYYDSTNWRGTWALDGGGALMNQGIHYVDLLQWMMGPVSCIYGHADTLIKKRIEVEDTAVACLRFQNGAMGVIEACTSAVRGMPARLEIRGENGTVIIEDGNIVLWDVDGETDRSHNAAHTGSGATDPMAITSIGHEAQIQDMVNAINENRSPLVDGREARKAIELITGIYKSSTTGLPVQLPL